MSNPYTDAPKYECQCVKCNLHFFAESKRALICLSCKPVGMTVTGEKSEGERNER